MSSEDNIEQTEQIEERVDVQQKDGLINTNSNICNVNPPDLLKAEPDDHQDDHQDSSIIASNELNSSSGPMGPVCSTNGISRSELFKEGLVLEEEGDPDGAIRLYLQSLTGMKEQTGFPELPHCLHHISKIYFNKNEYDKAVHFIQAEKLYYETALIDVAKFYVQLKNTQEPISGKKVDEIGEAVKSEQFEKLARLCKKEGNPHLALDYCGKATKMYRSLYGEDHIITKQALDLFTIIYADVGKEQYVKAMKRIDSENPSDDQPHTLLPRLGDTDRTQHKGVIRKRLVDGQEEKKATKKVRFEEYEPPPDNDEQDDVIMTSLMMILFIVVTIFIALIGSYLYCYNKSATSTMCATLKSDLSYYYMKMQYTYKYYFP